MDAEQREIWHEGGRERCVVCLDNIPHERIVHCEACGDPLCEQCRVMIFATGETLCPDCSGTSTGREEP